MKVAKLPYISARKCQGNSFDGHILDALGLGLASFDIGFGVWRLPIPVHSSASGAVH
jgi:hypothetical protein